MLRNLRRCFFRKYSSFASPTFLTNDYKCIEAWNSQTTSLIDKINLNDFYNILNQNYTSKGVISAIDVDIFANAAKDPVYLDELKDLLHKLRLTAETQNTLESTHHATIRNYLEFGNIEELVTILRDPLNFGIFLDFYAANILLDKLITSEHYELAAKVASVIMLQEDYSHDITNSFCKYACYKYLLLPRQPNPAPKETSNKVEEIKIRIKFLRNPYFDDHFDIQDLKELSGKTLAWISKIYSDNVNNNLNIMGWLYYQKYDQLASTIEELCKTSTFKVYNEILQCIDRELEEFNNDDLQTSKRLLKTATITDTKLEESLKIEIENAINKLQNKDILAQNELFTKWANIRKEKLDEQTNRLNRAKRLKDIEEKQKALHVEEQKLWFFDNEDKIDLQIEEKESNIESTVSKKSLQEKSDQNYVPPEILPKKRK